jgi:hypothetical protein
MERFLSLREAERCENAKEPVCKCRCGGAKHGAARASGLLGFNGLPEDDPHFIPAKKPKKTRAEIRAEIESMRFEP